MSEIFISIYKRTDLRVSRRPNVMGIRECKCFSFRFGRILNENEVAVLCVRRIDRARNGLAGKDGKFGITTTVGF